MIINEIFLSIQGEGLNSGIPTIFIRTTGCNLRCKWCDTKYSYSEGKEMTIQEIIRVCKKYYAKHICITGGEPLVQREELVKLITLLIKNRFNVQLQTNGSKNIANLPKELEIVMDIKCPSSRMQDKMIYENLDFIKDNDSVVFVVSDIKDYNFSKKIIKKYKLEDKVNVLIQPVFENNKFGEKIVNKILRDHLNVRFGIQLHKIIWNPKKRGV
jgi:7-carboxy-7-deazaguanine synthase